MKKETLRFSNGIRYSKHETYSLILKQDFFQDNSLPSTQRQKLCLTVGFKMECTLATVSCVFVKCTELMTGRGNPAAPSSAKEKWSLNQYFDFNELVILIPKLTELQLQCTSKYLVKTIGYVTFEGHYVLIRTKSICCISSVLKVYLFLSFLIRLFQYTVKWRLKTIMTLLNSKKKK